MVSHDLNLKNKFKDVIAFESFLNHESSIIFSFLFSFKQKSFCFLTILCVSLSIILFSSIDNFRKSAKKTFFSTQNQVI